MDIGVKPLAFVGQVPASKSILNRLLLIRSYFPELKITGESNADDVHHMREAINSFNKGEDIFVGAGGTTFRFMALRVSRKPGTYRLCGEERLFKRPQDELVKILMQLGVKADLKDDSMIIESNGWKLHGDTLLVPFARSSQFASSVLLNAWDLPFDLFVSLGGQKPSEGYWRMSQRMAIDLGMKIDFWDGDFRIPKGQKMVGTWYVAEPDLSSAFSLAAVAAVCGTASITDFPAQSLQPDGEFVRILASMGVPIVLSGTTLKIDKAPKLNGVAVNLKNCPDLFPVLSALCALADGDSHLYGASQLAYKESNRIQVMTEIIKRFGRKVEVLEDGIKITGKVHTPPGANLKIDTDKDHRVAFAGAVLRSAGYHVDIRNPEVVNKSFPEFWEILGWYPPSEKDLEIE